ncbi:MAG TPA: 3-methyl-2-oxobutanoate hydroxymethyltransferase [Candidatus Bathyarchaeia archaeon]|nr:MAG: 3-methyl-2-oxobutanoate hydroxymethyltransferase [Candidatus Bathyarchaeota archaeon RBG_16_48_13]HJX23388.1 3-methyl-2-oxobutanoate hydroxymethyltransferase [Candidatus Bathyarchaeia archaeon]
MSFQERIRQKKGKEKIIMLTAYDFQMARILARTGIDLILVGDSLAMVVQGRSDTKSVTMSDMIYHIKAAARGAENTPIIGDLPRDSCNSVEDGLRNAKLFIKAGAHGVKIEGKKAEVIKALASGGIPVMGHIGMLPQTAESYHVKGKKPEEAEQILQDARALDRLGVFSMVLECIPEDLAKMITETVDVPTIGIGAGKYCDGQVLVTNDMLGFDDDFKPKYVKVYANFNKATKDAVSKFIEEVFEGKFPDDEHTYH